MASAGVNGSPRIQTASAIVTMGDTVEIIDTAALETRARPALMRNVGSTVATMAHPAESQRKRGLAEKSPPPAMNWCKTQKTDADDNAMDVKSALPIGAMKRLA